MDENRKVLYNKDGEEHEKSIIYFINRGPF